MRYLFFISMITFLTSCSSGQKLVEREIDDGGKVIMKKGLFSGIDYIYIEKRLQRKVVYKLFYNCECGIERKLSVRKNFTDSKGQIAAAIAVTDSSFAKYKFFGDTIALNILVNPIEFIQITQEEINLLGEALSKVDKACCKNPDKPISKIIGYVVLN
jgi:hypothetical protein